MHLTLVIFCSQETPSALLEVHKYHFDNHIKKYDYDLALEYFNNKSGLRH